MNKQPQRGSSADAATTPQASSLNHAKQAATVAVEDLSQSASEASGEVNFVRNTGTVAMPAFKVESEAFQAVDAGRRSHPAFTDLDGDGDLDLLLGHESAGAVVYRNDGTKNEPRFSKTELFTDLHLPHSASPVFVDLDGDRQAELIAGSLSRGLTFFRRQK